MLIVNISDDSKCFPANTQNFDLRDERKQSAMVKSFSSAALAHSISPPLLPVGPFPSITHSSPFPKYLLKLGLTRSWKF